MRSVRAPETVRITDHALARAAEMDVDVDEIIAAVLRPDYSYPAAKGRTMSVAGRLAVAHHHRADPTVAWVATVLWATPATGRTGRGS